MGLDNRHGPQGPANNSTERWRRYMERVRANPEQILRHRLQSREKNRRWREKKKLEIQNLVRGAIIETASGEAGDV